MNRRLLLAGVGLLATLSSPLLRADDDSEEDRDAGQFIYTMSNAVAANQVMVYQRMTAGVLSPVGAVATGGKGSGAGLGSQGSLVLSGSHSWLLAVNAGSDDISVFRVTSTGLSLASRTASGGHMPISVTIAGRAVYVLNAGTPNNITGFTLGHDGSLTPIANSTASLSGPSVGPAQVQFDADGDQLVVTEKGTSMIDVFTVAHNGALGNRVSTLSHGMTPFGFAFGRKNRIFVSEAFGGGTNASAASSYNLSSAGTVQTISGSIGTQQTAACWLVVDPSGRYAYTTNTGSNTVSLFRIASDGSLTLVSSIAGSTPTGGPIDATFSADGRYLHVLTGGAASIVTFQVQSNGSLISVSTAMAPASAAGLAAQ